MIQEVGINTLIIITTTPHFRDKIRQKSIDMIEILYKTGYLFTIIIYKH